MKVLMKLFKGDQLEMKLIGLGEPEKRFDQLSQRRANRVHSQIEVNVPEHSCGNMSEVSEFCGALYRKNEVNSSKKYTKCCHDGKFRLPNLTEAPDLLKELLCSNSQEAKTIDSIFENIMLH
ncbi:hypothetical protein AVEN_4032-1 [Araneus ventricosus]|uniref:Helitron helicase-like domain-containing protein n=1 Tax=Araneus ventricosus TaxID=182803 RepID=A0A4Y2J4Z5_ARAVE|nr:hypothetical protein AVEN_4032-1 [Araneus ventricosus]